MMASKKKFVFDFMVVPAAKSKGFSAVLVKFDFRQEARIVSNESMPFVQINDIVHRYAAQAAALNHSKHVRALVLCDTRARIATAEAWQQRIDKVRSAGVESLLAMTMERRYSARFRERRGADVRGYSMMQRQTSVDGYIGTCSALRDTDLRPAMPHIKQPTWVLCGAEGIATSSRGATHDAILSGGGNCLTIYSTKAWRRGKPFSAPNM